MDDIKINPSNPTPENPEGNNVPETFALGGATAAGETPPAEQKIELDSTPPDSALEIKPAEPATTAQPLEQTVLEPTPAPAPEPDSIQPATEPALTPELSPVPAPEQPLAQPLSEPLPQNEPLPPPSDSLVEAATGIPQEEPEETAGMSKKKKIGLIVAGILVVASAIGALLYFSGGGPFRGQVAPPDGLKFAPVALCPTDYYAPKTSAYMNRDNWDLSIAKAQVIDDSDIYDTGIYEEQMDPFVGNDSEVPVPLDIPEGCYPIPHDNLLPGGDQCGLIDQLYIDPEGYFINDETKTHVAEWHAVCNPPVETPFCGENQVATAAAVGAAPMCVCMEGYFDVSYALPDYGATFNDAAINTLVCWNCDMLLSEIERYKTLLESASTLDEQTILQERIDSLEMLSVRNECGKTVQTRETCGENQVLTPDGVCICANHYTKAAVADICIYDCDAVVEKILDMRKSATTAVDAKLLVDLAALEEEAAFNGCDVPDEQTDCERYVSISNAAFNDRDYDLYYEYSGMYIDDNCSGSTVTDCQKILAKGVAVHRIISAMTGTAFSTDKWEQELNDLRGEYYADPYCNNTVDRCAELEAVYGSTAPSAPTGVTVDGYMTDRIEDVFLTDAVTPGNVFKDDLEYYETYCALDEFSCEEIVANMTLDQLAMLDVGEEELARYIACFDEERPPPRDDTREIPPPPAPDPVKPPSEPVSVPPSEPVEPPTEPVEPPTPPPAPAPIVSTPPAASPPPPTVVSTTSDETTVQTETAYVADVKISAPVPPVETVVDEQGEVIAPVTAPLHSAAPVYEEVPPEITPTGPGIYAYLAGLLFAQFIFFRKRIFAAMTSR